MEKQINRELEGMKEAPPEQRAQRDMEKEISRESATKRWQMSGDTTNIHQQMEGKLARIWK